MSAWLGVAVLYILIIALIAVAAFRYTAWRRRKRVEKKPAGVPPGFVCSKEVNIDPTTGAVQRVWYHPKTGERYYETVETNENP